MSHAKSHLLDLLLHALANTPASVLLTTHRDDHRENDSREGGEFGRLAEQSLLTGYESNDLIAVGNTQIMPLLFQRRTSRASTYHSGEDTAATPNDSEVDDSHIVGLLASPLYTQEREASADPSRIYHSNGENSVSSSSFFRQNVGNPARGCSHKKKSGTELHSDTRRVFGEREQLQGLLELRANPAARGQQEAVSRLSEAEFRTRILLEDRGKTRNTFAGIESCACRQFDTKFETASLFSGHR